MNATSVVIDLDKARAIGGTVYNHSGQIIAADSCFGHTLLFLGDDHGKYDAKDALVRDIIESPENWAVRGEVVAIEDDGDYLTVSSLADDLDDEGNDIKSASYEYIRYRYQDCTVIVLR